MQDSILMKRYSGRAFSDKPVTRKTLESVFEKVSWTPSCSNKQPWRFVAVTDGEPRASLNEALPRGNGWSNKAPVLVALCGRESDDYSREDNPIQYYQFDCGMACLALLLAALEEGLMGHPMAGYDAKVAKVALELGEDFHVLCLIAIGYEGAADQLSDRDKASAKAKRTRLNLDQILTFGKFDF